MSNFCITTLTHNAPGRAPLLRQTIASFFQHTRLPEKPTWFIYFNGMSPEMESTATSLLEEFRDRAELVLIQSYQNRGVGYGINRLNEAASDFDYNLFIEGDWLCLHPDDSGQPGDWLEKSLEVMEHERDLDCLYLRRFVHPIDSRMTGLQGWYHQLERPVVSHNGLKYLVCRLPAYTNNPLLRRKSSFERIFPLIEPASELKGNPNWGCAEIDACRRLGLSERPWLQTGILVWGNFLHIESADHVLDPKTLRIKLHPLCSPQGCKWGYYQHPQPHFCCLCPAKSQPQDLGPLMFGPEGDFLRALAKDPDSVRELMQSFNPEPMAADWAVQSYDKLRHTYPI